MSHRIKQAYEVFITRMQEAYVLLERSEVFLKQTEALHADFIKLDDHIRLIDKEKVIHPLYKIERIREASKIAQQVQDKAHLAEWTAAQAMDIADKAHAEWQSAKEGK